MAESILQRVAAGDAAAVQDCIDRFGALVWSLARRFSRNHADADDAVQEIYISIWENAGRFDPTVASETTFVAMIARRRLIDRRRRQVRRRDVTALNDVFLEPVVPAEGSLELTDEAARAALALGELRPEQREVLRLALMFGRTYEEIATSMHVPIGTVKTHARRGLMRIREMLGAGSSTAPSPAEVRT